MELDFRTWFEAHEGKKQKVRSLIDGHALIMFFTKGEGIFGAPEESRLVFAKMKNPDDDMSDGWQDEANFAAFDLIKALAGDKVENLFSTKDLGKIKVIDKDKAEEMLMNSEVEKMTQTIGNALKATHGKDGAGMIKLKDKK